MQEELIEKKVKSTAKIEKLAKQLHKWERRIVFTNGCFDILHPGHVKYLLKAKSFGDILIIGLNSDTSVKRLKGERRPIHNQKDRALVLSSLECVDYITLFEEDTPYDLINRIKPDILVKGGDWDVKDIVGADIVLSAGGEVLSLPYYEGHSTTGILEELSKPARKPKKAKTTRHKKE